MANMSNPEFLTCKNLVTSGDAIQHGYFSRKGGASSGIYGSLNLGLGSNDDPATVVENRAMVCKALGTDISNLATVSQCHTSDVVVATTAWQENRPKADAIVTNKQGLVIGILTADCGPVLFADASAGVIGAAHAGWKGAMTGVVENTIDAMIGLGAIRKNIVATLGPCISQKNYEVGAEYRARFINANSQNARYFTHSSREDHYLFDLAGLVVDRLNKAGVRGSKLGLCTYADEDSFYSYRRSVHKNEPDYGRQISAIKIQ